MLKSGNRVWVVIRDLDGEPIETQGLMLIATTSNAAILTPYLPGRTDLEDHCAYHIRETLYMGRSDVCFYPISDCYSDKDDADAVVDAAIAEEEV